MMTLVELQKEADTIVIDEEYCISLINQGELVKGYGLWLAKEKLHKDSKTGWTKFCVSIGIADTTAMRAINFYLAKSLPIGSKSLPDKEGAFRELSGNTVEEKTESYAEVKELTKKETPTALDINIVKKVKSKATSDKVRAEAIEVLSTAPTAVREAFVKNPRSVSEATRIIKEEGEEAAIEYLTAKPQVTIKETDNKVLRKENTLLKKALDWQETAQNLFTFIISIDQLITRISQHHAQLEGEMHKINSEAKKALQTLGLTIRDVMISGELKARYRELAKERHPDKGGSHELMTDLTKAYDTLKKYLEGK